MPRCARSLATTTAALTVAAIVVSGAGADASFSDAAGDQSDIAAVPGLDITTVDVTNTPDGLVTVRVTIANHQELPPGCVIGVVLDADEDRRTGGEAGADVVVALLHGFSGEEKLVFSRWSDVLGDFVETETTGTASFTAGAFTWTGPQSELLGTRSFRFGVVGVVSSFDGRSFGLDVAPDGAGLWNYELVGLPFAPPTELSATKPTGAPSHPVHGKRFTVNSLVMRADTGSLVDTGSVTCRARVGARKLRVAGTFRNPNARCLMTVPEDARGKLLRGTITTRANGGSVKRTFSFRVV